MRRDLKDRQQCVPDSKAQVEEHKAEDSYKGKGPIYSTHESHSVSAGNKASLNGPMKGPPTRGLRGGYESARTHQGSQRALEDTIGRLTRGSRSIGRREWSSRPRQRGGAEGSRVRECSRWIRVERGANRGADSRI